MKIALVLGALTLVGIAHAVAVTPAAAVPIDCKNPHDPIDKDVCADPRLRWLVSPLSAAYAAALARDHARAGALERDQKNWKGELYGRDISNTFFYASRPRIAFLLNVNNPHATRRLPIAQKLLEEVRTLPVGTDRVLNTLAKTGAVRIASPSLKDRFVSESGAISKLPAPPSESLRAALQGLGGPGGGAFTVVSIPSVDLGGAYITQGSADDEEWVLFRKQGDTTVPVSSPDVLIGNSERDGGSSGYLALIAGQLVAINETDDIYTHHADLQWQRWLGNTWGSPVRIRIRFDWASRGNDTARCRAASSLACVMYKAEVDAFKHYAQDPWVLQDPSWLTGSKRERFLRLKALAQSEALSDSQCHAWDFWFPARVGGQVVVGCIAAEYIGAHPANAFNISFWGWWDGKWTVQLLNDSLIPQNGRVLAAARMPPLLDGSQ